MPVAAAKFLFMQELFNYTFLCILSPEHKITCCTSFLMKINGKSLVLWSTKCDEIY